MDFCQHRDECFPSFQERNDARARLYDTAGSEFLFMQEAMYDELGPLMEPDIFDMS